MNKAMISTWKMSYDGMLKAKDILQQDGSVQAAILAAIQKLEKNLSQLDMAVCQMRRDMCSWIVLI